MRQRQVGFELRRTPRRDEEAEDERQRAASTIEECLRIEWQLAEQGGLDRSAGSSGEEQNGPVLLPVVSPRLERSAQGVRERGTVKAISRARPRVRVAKVDGRKVGHHPDHLGFVDLGDADGGVFAVVDVQDRDAERGQERGHFLDGVVQTRVEVHHDEVRRQRLGRVTQEDGSVGAVMHRSGVTEVTKVVRSIQPRKTEGEWTGFQDLQD